jgi:hypothetical protein
MDLALQILKGDVVLLVDVEEQTIMPMERSKAFDDFPKMNLKDWYERNANEILKNGEGLQKALDNMLFTMSFNNFHKTFEWSQLLDFVQGNDDVILDDLNEIDEVSQLKLLVTVTKNYIEKSTKILSVIDWVRKTYPDELIGMYNSEPSEQLIIVMNKFSEMLRQDYTKITKQIESVQNFVDATRENDEVLSKGIEPVNILDKWSAGWLSPEGDYYALNGEIANMLHIQIADALQDKGLIPELDKDGYKINPDAWLEQHGWVKIHDNNINYAGCLNHAINKKDVHMSQKQKDIIYNYGQRCHSGVLKYGWRRTAASAAKINLLDDEQLSKMYFEF